MAKPPNLRESTTGTRCGNCRFFDGTSRCNRYGYTVRDGQVSDGYQPRMSTLAQDVEFDPAKFALNLAQERESQEAVAEVEALHLSFSNIVFDPKKHPRLHGKFTRAELHSALTDEIKKLPVGKHIDLPGEHQYPGANPPMQPHMRITHSKNPHFTPEGTKHGQQPSLYHVGSAITSGPEDAANVALHRSAKSTHPDSLGGAKSFTSVVEAVKEHHRNNNWAKDVVKENRVRRGELGPNARKAANDAQSTDGKPELADINKLRNSSHAAGQHDWSKNLTKGERELHAKATSHPWTGKQIETKTPSGGKVQSTVIGAHPHGGLVVHNDKGAIFWRPPHEEDKSTLAGSHKPGDSVRGAVGSAFANEGVGKVTRIQDDGTVNVTFNGRNIKGIKPHVLEKAQDGTAHRAKASTPVNDQRTTTAQNRSVEARILQQIRSTKSPKEKAALEARLLEHRTQRGHRKI